MTKYLFLLAFILPFMAIGQFKMSAADKKTFDSLVQAPLTLAVTRDTVLVYLLVTHKPDGSNPFGTYPSSSLRAWEVREHQGLWYHASRYLSFVKKEPIPDNLIIWDRREVKQ